LNVLSSVLIKAKAHELGFDLCGIAPAESFPELSFLSEWIARGHAGDMTYMARSAARRADVRAVLPDARSVIVTGTVYNVDRPYSTESAEPDIAQVSRYAWGDDYHGVLEHRLQNLLAWMRTASSEQFDARAYVDTGPVQERVYAQYAGLGWVGKNTCLINSELGSWLFLSEIICTLSLDCDQPGFDRCGTCTLCLEACPTGAIPEPHVLDATRCLSYLTIELRGEIPEQQRASLGRHVYGCDICQEVCPYNQLVPRSTESSWQPRAGLDLPKLVDLWKRSDTELRRLLRGSAMRRARLTGLRRNLAVAIGNSGDHDAVAALTDRGGDRASIDDPLVQSHISWALRQRSEQAFDEAEVRRADHNSERPPG
jgi:epoxyqueuosine reductase